MPPKRKASDDDLDFKPTKQVKVGEKATRVTRRPPKADKAPEHGSISTQTKKSCVSESTIIVLDTPVPHSPGHRHVAPTASILKTSMKQLPCTTTENDLISRSAGLKLTSLKRTSWSPNARFNFISMLRHHYDRFRDTTGENFISTGIPGHFGQAKDLMDSARTASRSSALGILDSIIREFIIFWFPATEQFLVAADDAIPDWQKIEDYKYLVHSSAEDIWRPAMQVKGLSKSEEELRIALGFWVDRSLGKLWQAYSKYLKTKDRDRYRLISAAEDTARQMTTRSMSEARTLNSSIVWDVADDDKENILAEPSDTNPTSPLRIPNYTDTVDASDSGQIWGGLPSAHDFEFSFRAPGHFTPDDIAATDDAGIVTVPDEQHEYNFVSSFSTASNGHINSYGKATGRGAVPTNKTALKAGPDLTGNQNCAIM